MDIKYNRDHGEVELSQSHLSREIFGRFSMEGCKLSPTPMEAKLILHHHLEGDANLLYIQFSGRAIHSILCSRADPSFSVCVLRKFLSSPTYAHLQFARRILRYSQGSIGMLLSFRRADHLPIVGYYDVDWAYFIDCKSSNGYIV